MIVRLTAYSKRPIDPLEDSVQLFSVDFEFESLPRIGDWIDSADAYFDEYEVFVVKAVFHHGLKQPREATGFVTVDSIRSWTEVIVEPR